MKNDKTTTVNTVHSNMSVFKKELRNWTKHLTAKTRFYNTKLEITMGLLFNNLNLNNDERQKVKL